jgi:hypothetical protein
MMSGMHGRHDIAEHRTREHTVDDNSDRHEVTGR